MPLYYKNTGSASSTYDPALTFTLEDFIDMKISDEMTYYNFSIIENINNIEYLDHNLIEDYLPELNKLCIPVSLTSEQFKRYKYAPDLLAYDVYGSVQLDFIVLMANDMIDPKEFCKTEIKLPYASSLRNFLGTIYSKEKNYITKNRYDNNIK